jgi:predicted DNA-binding protein (UPF0251 family)
MDPSPFTPLLAHLLAAALPRLARLLDRFIQARDAAKTLWVDKENHFNGQLDGALVALREARVSLWAMCPTLPEGWARLPQLGTLPSAGQLAKDDASEKLLAFRSFVRTTRPRKRRRKADRPVAPLTAKETEAAQLVGEHKGSFASAAHAAGVSRQAMAKRYKKAMAKLGESAARQKRPQTQRLPEDRRGQATIPAPKQEED